MTDATLTQTEAIRAHLLSGGTLTPVEALTKFGCFRLAARIHDLREQGLAITGDMVTSANNGKRYMQYALEVAQEVSA